MGCSENAPESDSSRTKRKPTPRASRTSNVKREDRSRVRQSSAAARPESSQRVRRNPVQNRSAERGSVQAHVQRRPAERSQAQGRSAERSGSRTQPPRRRYEAPRAIEPVPQRRSIAFYGIVGALVLVVLFVGVGFFLPKGGEGDAAQSHAQANESQQEEGKAPAFQGMEGVEYPDPASLAWRDEDFALNAEKKTEWNTDKEDEKVIYLTFDDGPSARTLEILDILDKYHAKATFFVIGQEPDHFHLIAEAYHRGHTIGLHTMSHEYDEVYSSEQAFLTDLEEIGTVVKEQIGYVPCFTRFPGGSSNTISKKYTQGIMTTLTEKLPEMGYQYYDWNLDSGDGANASRDAMVSTLTGEVSEDDEPKTLIVLCHDAKAKEATVAMLPEFIEYYQSIGYEFKAIDRSSWVYHHTVNN